jgi:hypothetical protein
MPDPAQPLPEDASASEIEDRFLKLADERDPSRYDLLALPNAPVADLLNERTTAPGKCVPHLARNPLLIVWMVDESGSFDALAGRQTLLRWATYYNIVAIAKKHDIRTEAGAAHIDRISQEISREGSVISAASIRKLFHPDTTCVMTFCGYLAEWRGIQHLEWAAYLVGIFRSELGAEAYVPYQNIL